MDYELTDSQKEFVKKIKKLSAGSIAATADLPEDTPKEKIAGFIKQNLKTLAAADFLKQAVSDDNVGFYAAGEELARVCPSTFFSAASSAAFAGRALQLFGTAEQKAKYLTSLVSGDQIGALAIVEADAGSDISGIKTTAEKRGDKWILSGSKYLVTNAPVADLFLVIAWTDKAAGLPKGLTLFILDRNTKGLKVGSPLETMGLRGALIAGIEIAGCEVGPQAVLGTETGAGYKQYNEIMPFMHLAIASYSLGIASSCMEESLKHAKGRQAFGKPIGLFEGVGAKLATMFTFLDLARMMTLRAAWGMEQKEIEVAILASQAKLFASEAVNKISDLAMQIHAGHGFIKGAKVERLYRDARFAEIAYGTSEMLRASIAQSCLDKYK